MSHYHETHTKEGNGTNSFLSSNPTICLLISLSLKSSKTPTEKGYLPRSAKCHEHERSKNKGSQPEVDKETK